MSLAVLSCSDTAFQSMREEGKVCRTSGSTIALLVIILAAVLSWGQAPSKPATTRRDAEKEDFAAAINRLRDTWVKEFNARHADKIANLYAEEAVLLRGNGSLHNRESIQAEWQRSITSVQGSNYRVKSLHSEGSGDLGYDTGIYNEDFPHHVAEGNYLLVVKRINGEWKIVAHAAVPNPRMQ